MPNEVQEKLKSVLGKEIDEILGKNGSPQGRKIFSIKGIKDAT